MNYTFGAKLKQLRTNRGWTLEQLAARSGLSISHISSLERGTRTKPSFMVAVRLAEALEVPLWTFLDDPDAETVRRLAALSPERPERATLEHLPEEIRSFVAREDAAPYLHLAKRLQEAHVPPEQMEKWLERMWRRDFDAGNGSS
ncbi:MAG: helix-turn-helix transcriptional regulator [Alicyclobacillaceae bacterium]|nr:helix-turn-helix transcriptional regulator [Alicyclobacillaceae bacterium]